jgi:hypothetical protein
MARRRNARHPRRGTVSGAWPGPASSSPLSYCRETMKGDGDGRRKMREQLGPTHNTACQWRGVVGNWSGRHGYFIVHSCGPAA